MTTLAITDRTVPQAEYHRLAMLLELRATNRRLALALNETRDAADQLSRGWISPEGAMGLLAEALQHLEVDG